MYYYYYYYYYSEAIEAQHIYKSNFIAAGSGVFQEPSRSKVFDSLLQVRT